MRSRAVNSAKQVANASLLAGTGPDWLQKLVLPPQLCRMHRAQRCPPVRAALAQSRRRRWPAGQRPGSTAARPAPGSSTCRQDDVNGPTSAMGAGYSASSLQGRSAAPSLCLSCCCRPRAACRQPPLLPPGQAQAHLPQSPCPTPAPAPAPPEGRPLVDVAHGDGGVQHLGRQRVALYGAAAGVFMRGGCPIWPSAAARAGSARSPALGGLIRSRSLSRLQAPAPLQAPHRRLQQPEEQAAARQQQRGGQPKHEARVAAQQRHHALRLVGAVHTRHAVKHVIAALGG